MSTTYQEYMDARQAWLEAEQQHLIAREQVDHAQIKRVLAWNKLSSMSAELNDTDRARVINETWPSDAQKYVETGS